MADLRLPDLNRVFLAGRLTRDPELRYVAGNRAVCDLRLVNTRYFKKQDGSRGEASTFVDVSVWDKQAEYLGDKLKKGRPVLVEGSLKFDEWEDRTSGQKRSKLTVNAQRVTPLDWDDDGPGGGGSRGGGSGGGGRGGGGGSYGGGGREAPAPEPEAEDDIPF